MNDVLQRFSRSLFDRFNATGSSDPEGDKPGYALAYLLFEIFVVGASINLAWYWGRYAVRIEQVILKLGISNYIDLSFVYGTSMPLVLAGIITGLLLLGLARVSRYAYGAGFLLLHFQFSIRFVLGEIPHSANLVGMALLSLGLAHLIFGDSVDRRRFVLGFNYFFIGLGYTSAAICKLVATGITWPLGRHLRLWIFEKHTDNMAKLGEIPLNAIQELAVSSDLIGTGMLTFGLVAELLAVGLWFRKTRTLTAIAVLALHFGIFMQMGILFLDAMVIVTLVGLPVGAAFEWVRTSLARRSA